MVIQDAISNITEGGIIFARKDSEDKKVLYSDILKDSLNYLGYFQYRNIKPKDEIIILLDDEQDFITAFWAAILGGVIAVPISSKNNENSKKKFFKVWNKLNNPFVIGTKENISSMLQYGKTINIGGIKERFLDVEDVKKYYSDGIVYNSSKDDIALIQFSSGSTGDPKGVMLSHNNIIKNLQGLIHGHNINNKDIVLFWMPLVYDFGLIACHILAFVMQIDQVIIRTSDFMEHPSFWIKSIDKYRATILSSPNFGYKHVLDNIDDELINCDLSKVRVIMNGGEGISLKLCNEFLSFFESNNLSKYAMAPCYGLAEGTLLVTITHNQSNGLQSIAIDRKNIKIGSKIICLENSNEGLEAVSVGEVTENMSLRLVNESRQVLSDNTIGLIEIKGECVTKGYYNDKEKTERALNKDGWFNTEDLGFINNGNVYIVGRAKDLIIVNGENYYANDIERVIKDKAKVDVGVIGIQDDNEKGENVIAFVKYFDDLKDFLLVEKKVRRSINEEIGINLNQVIPIKELPTTDSGKVQRFALKQGYELGIFDKVINELEKIKRKIYKKEKIKESLSPIEKRVSEVISDVLNVNFIGLNESLYEYGIDSLKSAKIIARIELEFNKYINIQEFLKNPTIKNISNMLHNKKEKRKINNINILGNKELYKISSVQKRMYVINRLNEESLAYNVPSMIVIEGNLKREKIEYIINKIIERHESLRTYFQESNGEIFQRISDELKIHVPIIEKEEEITEEEFIKCFKEDFIKPFDLNNSPLIRASLAKVNDKKHILFLDFHHIIFDGASSKIFLNEFKSLYCEEELPKLDVQYKDYVHWNKEYILGIKNDREMFWRDMFNEESEVLKLPIDNIDKKINEFIGDIVCFQFDEKTTHCIDEMCKSLKVTPYVFFLGVINVLLYKYSSQEDIVIGTVVDGRINNLVDNLIGMFVNTIVVRNKIDGNRKFNEFLNDVRMNTLKALENSDYPYEHILESLNLQNNELYNVMYVFQNQKPEKMEIDNIKLIPKKINSYTSQNDLIFEIYKEEEKYKCELTFRVNSFKLKTVNRIKNHMENLVNNIISDDKKMIYDYEIMLGNEKKSLLMLSNNTNKVYPKHRSIQEIFQEQVVSSPKKIAVVFKDKSLSYEELNKRSNSLAYILREKGIKKESVVGIVCDRSIEAIVGILAIIKAGGAYEPIDPSYPKERIEYMLKDSNVKLLLKKNSIELDIDFNEVVDLDDEKLYYKVVNNIDIENDSNDLAYIIYTSGTTGKPKGVMCIHKNIIRLVKNTNYIDFRSNDKILQTGSMVFDASTFEVWGALLNGLELHLAEKEDILISKRIHKIIEEEGITIMWLTSELFNQLAEDNIELFKGLRYLLIGGDVISPKYVNLVRNKWKDLIIINGYGPTENTTFSLTYNIEHDFTTDIPIGKPISNSNAYILDKKLNILPVGAIGEICLSGDGLSRGYINNLELTMEKFVDNPFNEGTKMYRSGDLGRWNNDGDIEFLGRIDNQIKIRGYRIELGEIESTLLKIPDIKECAVLVNNYEDEKYICAYYVSDKKLFVEDLRLELKQRVPSYMIPDQFISIEKMPLTINGKLDRRNLPRVEVKEEDKCIELPQTETEIILKDIWCKVLKMKKIGVNENFFDLGGQSLRATLMVSMIKKQLNKEISLREVFKYPTIKSLSKYLGGVDESTLEKLDKQEEESYYKASSAQKRMYMLYELDKDSTAYNIPMVFNIKGNLNIKKIERTFEKIIERHEGLRTYFDNIDGKIVQRIEDFVKVNLSVSKEIGEIEEVLKKFKQPFNLNKYPLYRGKIVDLNGEKYLLVDIHHIIIDGFSINILIEEFKNIYDEKLLDDVHLQYKDFASWQNEFVKSKEIIKQEEYWLKEFADDVPNLGLPCDYERPLVQQFNGKTIGYDLNNDLKIDLINIAKKSETTIHMVLLAAFNILLSKCSNLEDIVVGVPVSGRSNGNFDNVVGMFVNTVVLRTAPSGNKTYLEFLKEVREKCLSAYENSDFQFDDLIDRLQIKRDSSRNPLFNVMFNYIDTANIYDIKFEDTSFLRHDISNSYDISKFDMKLNVYEVEDSFKFSIEYCTKLFKEETIKRIGNYYIRILENITSNLNIQIKNIDFLGQKEKENLLINFNNTETFFEKDKTIQQVFEEYVDRMPNNIAVVYNNEKLTYRELNEKSNSLAYILRDKGVRENTFVGIMVDRSLEMIIAVFAVLKAGGAYIPMDIEYPDNRLLYMIEDSNCKLILTNTDRIKGLNYKGEVIQLKDKSMYGGNTFNISNINSSRDLAYVIYTSGSTGKPKGVLINHEGIINFKTAYKHDLNITEKDRTTMFASFSFDASVAEMMMTLLNGACLHVLSKETINDYNKLTNYLNDNKITIAKFPPAYIIHLDSSKIKTVKLVVTAGSATNWEIINKWSVGREYINAYGPTEGTIVATIWHYNRDTSKVISIGKPLYNTKIYIMDKYLNIQPIGVKGEICISGVGVSQGYLNKKELTNEKFIDSPFEENMKVYKTGDLGRYLPDGNIEYLGRIDNQVKIRGLRIELGEIESKILEHDDVKEVFVNVFEDQTGEKHICAYVVPEKDIKELELKEYLKKTLPNYMIPDKVISISKMPLTVNGKIDSKRLPTPSFSYSTKNYEAPTNEIEKQLSNLWCEVLGIKNVGVNENFFDLGGQSLKAIILKTKIHEKFRKDLPLKEIFKFPTIKSLSTVINNLCDSDDIFIENVKESDYYEASSVQKRMYMLYELDKASTSYNMPMCYEIRGHYDIEKLEDTFRKLLNRHESLRTYFDNVNGDIVQRISKDSDVRLIVKKIQGTLDEEISEYIKPFDLNRYPLFKGEIIEKDDENYLLIDIHHIIVDGFSIDLLIKEFKEIYEGKNLDELSLQYKEFSNWHNKFLNSQKIKEQEKFWIDIFKDDIPNLNLQYDFNRPKRQSFQGTNFSFKLNSEGTEKIRDIAKETGTTMHMVLLSAFNILLSKVSMQEDITIGIPTSGRSNKDFQNIVGMFVNTLVMRNKPLGNKRYIDFLNEVKKNAIKAYENADYQFDMLVEKLGVVKDESRNPIFDVMFNYVDTAKEEDIYIEDIVLHKTKLKSRISKFDFTLNACETSSEIEFSIEYCNKLFKNQTIKRISEFYINILQSIAKDVTIPLMKIEIISNEEKVKIFNEFNDTEKYYEKNRTIHAVFEDMVTKYPNNNALVFKKKILTYKEVNEKANSLAHILREKGIGRGSFVSIMVDRSLEMVISVLAVLKAGGAYIPMDIDYPDARLIYILEDSKCKVVLSNNDRISELAYSGQVIDLRDESLFNSDIKSLKDINEGEDIAYVIYTSGSTGAPKGVQVKHDGVINFKTAYQEHLNITEKDRIIQFASFSFDASVAEIVMTLLNGACLYIVEKDIINSYDKFIDYLNNNKITIATLPPAYVSNISSNKVKYLEKILTAGSSTNCEIVKDWSMGREYINAYGPTEATIGVSMWHFNNKNSKVIPIGKPINNVKIYILDKYLNMQPIGVLGEICISGPGIAKGYLNKEELNNDRFVDNPFEGNMKMYRTGDIGRYLDDGNIEFLGRMDNQVKVRGFRIELGEIENAILKEDYIKEAVVTVNEDKFKEKYICAYIVYNEGEEEEKLREYLKNNLPDYMIPSYYIPLKNLPLTINGKIDKKALPKVNSNVNSKEYVAPKNIVEKRLIEEWENVTGVTGIGIKDRYYNFGGTSLKAIKFVLRLSNEYKINVNDVFECRTIEELAKTVSFSNEELIEKLDLFKKDENQEEVCADLIGYDDYIIKNECYLNNRFSDKKKYRNILLNGATGFLGVNLLYHILMHTNYSVSVILRAREKENAEERLKNTLNYHFHSDIINEFKDRISIYEGDLTKESFGLKEDEYLYLSNHVDCVINCAANVKHYGEYEKFYNINVNAVNFIIKFCKLGKKKDIHHVSTVSVSMGTIEDRKRALFTEYDCDLGKKYENYYIKTKLLAEKELLKAREESISVNIYRVGNLVGNSNSGIFQQNISENAFYQRIKAYIGLGVAIKSEEKILEFSFVDDVSKGFIELFDKEGLSNETFHLYNPNRISMNDFSKILEGNNITLQLLNGQEYIEKLKKLYNKEEYKNTVNDLIIYSEVFSREVKTEVIIVNDKTNLILEKLGFKWKDINKNNVGNIINYCKEVKFI
ncbi:MAG: amino acid adenylation domain-containing protein [Clostridium sp.]|nr:amino acid adenylation domain-containing protein [Clostridium sp.]